MNAIFRIIILILIAQLVAACGGSALSITETEEPDPIVIDVPIAYIKRDLSVSEGEPLRDIRLPAEFIPGASLLVRERASTLAQEIDLTPVLLDVMFEGEVPSGNNGEPLSIDIKDLETDYSGNRLIFAARAPQLEAIEGTPTWNIFEYDLALSQIRRVISSTLVAEAGDDTGPTYLADGRIVFSSTRQRGNQARLLDEDKPQYQGLEERLEVASSVLHIMESDGSDITQISFNQSHDVDPIVLQNGKILFSRWDQNDGDKGFNLYQINADGSDLSLMYGRHSHESIAELPDVQYANSSVTPDGKILVGVNSFANPLFGTKFISIDIDAYVDNTQAIASMQSLSGPAQQDVLFENIVLGDTVSQQGYIYTLYPLWDGSGRILFAWSQCLLLNPLPEGSPDDTERTIAPCTDENLANSEFDTAPSVYGLWMFDPSIETNDGLGTQLPLVIAQTEQAFSEVVAMEERPFPANPQSTIDLSQQTLIDDGFGTLHIQSVYDFDGVDSTPNGLEVMRDPLVTPALDRPAQFLRVVKSVSIPDEDVLDLDNSAFGRSANQLMREIVGYTPIQPDGSVEVTIPANIPFTIAVVDINGKRISQRHNNWLQLMPGEQKNCIGCHTNDSEAPHGRIEAQAPSINTGAPSTGIPFANTNPDLFADLGETMAQTFTRIRGLPSLTPDIVFADVWVDENLQSPAESFTYAYSELDTELPITQACAQNWTAICRSVINYPEHIAPIIALERTVSDELGTIIQDNTCIACHSPQDAQGEVRVPAGQLDLRSVASSVDPDFVTSYRELMFNDVELEVVEGALLPRTVPILDENGEPTFLRDEEGELVLDAEDNPIPLTQTVPVLSSMGTRGALSSNRFFSPFEGGSHQGWLSESELRIIAEWLDIGGQYYNNPFDAPVD